MNLSSPDMSIEPVDLSGRAMSSQVVSVPDSVPSTTMTDSDSILPENFEPGNYDVICGRGKGCAAWIGNRRFRVTIGMNRDRYVAAPTKIDKSAVVEEIVKTIASASPTGGFIKKDLATGRWYKINKQAARDKVGHAMRDAVKADEKKKNRQFKSRSSECRKRKSSRTSSSSARTPSTASAVTRKSSLRSSATATAPPTAAVAAMPIRHPSSSELMLAAAATPLTSSNTHVSNNLRRSLRASIRQSFRGSIKDSELAAILLEALENSSDYEDLSLLTETALFRFEQGA